MRSSQNIKTAGDKRNKANCPQSSTSSGSLFVMKLVLYMFAVHWNSNNNLFNLYRFSVLKCFFECFEFLQSNVSWRLKKKCFYFPVLTVFVFVSVLPADIPGCTLKLASWTLTSTAWRKQCWTFLLTTSEWLYNWTYNYTIAYQSVIYFFDQFISAMLLNVSRWTHAVQQRFTLAA